MTDEATQEAKEAREKRIVRNVRLGLAIPVGILLVIFLIAGLYSFVGPTEPTEKKDFVQAVGVLFAALAGLFGLFFTAQNVRTNQRTLRANLENTQRTLELTERGQITERFTRAIEQLGETDDKTGKPKIELRLGGIYALERIAKDSPASDYSTVMEVLTAYVRENAPYYPSSEAEEAAEQAEGGERDKAVEPQELAFPQEQRAAIRAIGDVIRRLNGENGVPGKYLDLVRLDLDNTNLRETNLQGAILQLALRIPDTGSPVSENTSSRQPGE
jgi:hypothetical protein